jgi:hypothetical protein
MKQLLILVLVLITVQPLFGQLDTTSMRQKRDSSNNIKETNLPIPEFKKKPYLLDENSNSLIELEKPNITVQGKLKGIGKAQSISIVDDPSSPVKIKKTDTLRFIVRGTPDVDPRDEFELIQFTVKKNKREIVVDEANGWKGTSKTVYTKIPYSIKKVIEGVYLLLVFNLHPGEYFIANSGIYYAFSLE